MPRALRVLQPGDLHHVGHHANAGRRLFADDRDRERLLRLLRDAAQAHDLRVLSWCLMDTHYHALVEDPRAQLSQAMRELHGAFARCRNAKDGVVGSLLRSRYFSAAVRDDDHLRAVASYIPNNPVAAGMVDRPEQWAWSSHRATVLGLSDRIADTGRLLEWFEDSRERYERVVDRVGHAGPAPPPTPLPLAMLTEVRPSLEELLAGRDRVAAAVLARRWGYRLREIGEALEVSTATVGRWTTDEKKCAAPFLAADWRG